MSVPLVTVVMPVHNGEAFLTEALDSVLGQSLTDLEFIIVDDGSDDRSPDLVVGRCDPRIKLLRNPGNLGQVRSLNIALGLARGTYVARLDQDDVARPRRLERQIAYLEAHPDVAVLGTWCRFIDRAGRPIGYFRPPTEHEPILEAMARMNPFIHSSVMFRREAVAGLGGYPEEYSYAMDFALWLVLARTYRLANLAEELLDYRVHPASVTRRVAAQYAAHRREELRLFRAALAQLILPPGVRTRWRRRVAWTALKLLAARITPQPLWSNVYRVWRRLHRGDGVILRIED